MTPGGVIYVLKGAWPMNDDNWTPPPAREMTHEELWTQRLLLGPGVQRESSGERVWFAVCVAVLAIWAAFLWSALV